MADETERIEEMAATMKAAALDEMRQELEAAGYDVVEDLGLGFVYAPNRSTRFYGGDNVNEAIEYAYRHFQEKRRVTELEAHNAAMKALLADIEYATKPPSNYLNFQDALYMIHGKIENFRKRTKAEE